MRLVLATRISDHGQALEALDWKASECVCVLSYTPYGTYNYLSRSVA